MRRPSRHWLMRRCAPDFAISAPRSRRATSRRRRRSRACKERTSRSGRRLSRRPISRRSDMSEEATAVLAAFAASLTYEAIPERVRDCCKAPLLEALACAVAGHAGEETHQVAALSSALGQSRESTVIGGDRLSLAGATMLNGYLITAVTMCDAHRPTMTHVTPEVVPPALAIAERDALPGRDLLVALAAGLEVTTRIWIGVDFAAFRARGWHGPGIFGPFGAAGAGGRPFHFPTQPMSRA